MPEGTIGKYRLVAELGQGGMADVFLAVATGPAGLGFSKLVVIKRLREHLANDPDFVAMLVDEARIAARLNHPNVVQTIEIGEADGQYFLAMEYLDGQAFRTIVRRAAGNRRGGGLPLRLHLGVLRRVLAGLHHAHELADYDRSPLHIVHRDVTPHNVFVTYDGQVKVVDFGIAKAVGRVSETRHGMIKGKLAYMAPEQAQGQTVDRRADIFSVGVMLWEAMTGARMWAGVKDDAEILRRLVGGKIPSSSRAFRADAPPGIDAVCRRALAVHREDRYATADEFEAALSAFADTSGQASDRELGTYVSDLFVDAREKAQGVIEAQLSQLRSSVPSRSFRLVSFPSESAPSATVPPVSISHLQSAPPSKEATATLVGPTFGGTLPSVGQPRKPRTDRLAALAVIGIVALGLAGWAIRMYIAETSPSNRSLSSAASVGQIPSPVPPASEAALPAEVTVTLRAAPAEAQFSIDDGPTLPNPYVGRRVKDSSTHRITVKATGYSTLNQEMTFDDDVGLQLSLAREVDAGTRGPVPRWQRR